MTDKMTDQHHITYDPAVERTLMVSLMGCDNMLQVVQHLCIYAHHNQVHSLIVGRYSQFNQTYIEVTPWSHPLMGATKKKGSSSDTLLPWRDVSALSLDMISTKLDEKTEQRFVTTSDDDAFDPSDPTVVDPVTTTHHTPTKMVAVRLHRPDGQQFGVLAFVAAASSPLFVHGASPTAAPSTHEQTFVQLAEISLHRTSKGVVIQQNNDILHKITATTELELGLLAVDLDGRLVEYNATLEQMVGWSSSEIQQKGWTNCVYPDPNVRKEMEKGIATLLFGVKGHTIERTLTRKNGTTKAFTVTSFSVHVDNGGPPILCGVFRAADTGGKKKRGSSVDDENETEQKEESTVVDTTRPIAQAAINPSSPPPSPPLAAAAAAAAPSNQPSNQERDMHLQRLGMFKYSLLVAVESSIVKKPVLPIELTYSFLIYR